MNASVTCLALLLALGAAPAVCQDSTDGLLAGPKVEDESQPGEAVLFGGQVRGAALPDVPPFRWFQLLRTLDLGIDQAMEIGAVYRRHEQAMREYREEHAAALRQLEQERREAREQGRDLPPQTAMRFRGILSQAPQATETQQAIWNLLTPEQQDAMRTLIEQERDRMRRDRRPLSDSASDSTPPTDTASDPASDTASDSDSMMVMDQSDTGGDPDQMMMMTMTTTTTAMTGGDENMEDDAATASTTAADPALSPRALRRIHFLRAHQKYRPRGTPPREDDKAFEFDETNEDDEDGAR